jgi:hypothetical protein
MESNTTTTNLTTFFTPLVGWHNVDISSYVNNETKKEIKKIEGQISYCCWVHPKAPNSYFMFLESSHFMPLFF